MLKYVKTGIAVIMLLALTSGGLLASDALKVTFGEPRWHTKFNSLVDVVGGLGTKIDDLGTLIYGWAIEDDLVVMIPATPTYVDNNTFTLPGDYSGRFSTGKVVHVQVAAGMVYSTVASSSYAGGATTVNLNDTVLTDPITRVYVVATRDGLWPHGPGYVVAVDYGGGIPSRPALAAADAVATASGKDLLIGPGTWVLDDDVTLLSPRVRVMPGVDLQIATAKTLTITGAFEAGRYQVFDCAGTGKVAFTGNVPARLPEWWGAAPDGVTDSTAAIQAACTSLPAAKGGVIDFAVGTYLITPGQIVISTPGTVLQGKGAATDGAGSLAGTALKSAAGTGKMIAFQGALATTPIDSCQLNDLTLAGDNKTVQGLSLKWVSNFRSRNVWITNCFDHGAYLEQVWDSSFYDLEIESCGDQGTSKVGLYIYNGATGNCNNLRFFSFHAEINFGNDVLIDSRGAGTGGNHNILFQGGKFEKSQAVGSYSTKAVHIIGYDGVDGLPNQNITIRDMGLFNYMVAGDIAVHFAGSGYMTVENCMILNNTDGGTGIKIEGPVLGPHTHRIIGNRFTNILEITIDTATCPLAQVWTGDNSNALWSASDSRIRINGVLVNDRRDGVEKYALLQNRKTAGGGGGSATLGAWYIIPINTEQEDADSIVDSSALPAFSLGAGTYSIEVVAPFYQTSYSQIRLYRVSPSAAVVLDGEGIEAAASVSATVHCHLKGTVSPTETTQYRLEYRTNASLATNGLGKPGTFGPEVYAQVKITKIK